VSLLSQRLPRGRGRSAVRARAVRASLIRSASDRPEAAANRERSCLTPSGRYTVILFNKLLLGPSIYTEQSVYTSDVAKHLIDVDEDTLSAARAELGTTTIKDTVNEALRRATSRRQRQVASALDVLADAHLDDRSEAWR